MKAMLIIVLALIAGFGLLARFDAPAPLPIVRAGLPTQPPPGPAQDMLFAPCPLTPRNLPLHDERKA